MPLANLPFHDLTGPLVRGVGEGGVSGFSPLSLFSASQDGALFNFTDAAATYQDSVGTTAGVAGQGIGLELDRRFGLALGAEMMPATYTGTMAGSFTLTNNTLSRNGTTTQAVFLDLSAAPVAGAQYAIQFTVSGQSGDTFAVRLGSPTWGGTPFYSIPSGDRIVSIILTSISSSARLWFAGLNGTAGQGSITNISVKLLAGNHALQTTTASKPTLQAGYVSLDAFDDFLPCTSGGGGTSGILLAAGIRAGSAGTARTIWSDRGTNTGYRLSLDTSNALVLSAGNGSAFTSVTGPTVTAGTDYVVMGWHDGTNLNVRVGLGSATSAAFATATAGTAGFTMGRDNGTAAGLYGDRIYSLLYRKNDTSTAAQRDGVSRYLANLSAITL